MLIRIVTSMFPRNKRRSGQIRRPALPVEHLEDRTLLSVMPTVPSIGTRDSMAVALPSTSNRTGTIITMHPATNHSSQPTIVDEIGSGDVLLTHPQGFSAHNAVHGQNASGGIVHIDLRHAVAITVNGDFVE
jgi:hypothetical protein